MFEVVRYFLVGGFTFSFIVCVAFLAYDWVVTKDAEFDESTRSAQMAELYALRWNGFITPEEYGDRVCALYGIGKEKDDTNKTETQVRRNRKGSWRIHLEFQGPQRWGVTREVLSADA